MIVHIARSTPSRDEGFAASLRKSSYADRIGGGAPLGFQVVPQHDGVGADHANALRRAERIRQAVYNYGMEYAKVKDLPMTVSVGVATYPSFLESAKALYKIADDEYVMMPSDINHSPWFETLREKLGLEVEVRYCDDGAKVPPQRC